MTNDCKTCPVSTGTHKPAEAVHQIDEPQAEALRLADDCEESATHWVHEIDTRAKAAKMLRAQHACIAELESQLEAIGAGGVEPLRKQVAPPIAWPKDAQDVRDFFRADFITVQFAAEDLTPCDEDRYLISAHDFLSAVNWWADSPHIPRTPGTAPSAAPVPDERAAFEAWLGIKPCGAAHDLAWSTWKARAALSATHPTQQGLDAQALKQSFREYLSVSEHIDAGGHAMDSIATDLTRIVLTEEEVSAVIARRNHCNASGQAGEDAANIRAAALAAQAKRDRL